MADERPASGGEDAEPESELDDEFASLRLDESFVKAATRSEAPAAHRAPTRPVAPHPPRRRRLTRQKAWIQRHRWVPYVAVVVAAVIGVAAVRHVGPFASGGGSGPGTSAIGVPTAHSLRTSAPSGSTTSTTPRVELSARKYSPGNCVTWDQELTGAVKPTLVVPCTQDHLIEIVSKATIPTSVSQFPDGQGWINLAQILCAQPVTTYLGYALDPFGRFQISSINPTIESWKQGDRTLWCGIGLGGAIDAPTVPFTGTVRGQSQQLLNPVGTCLNFDPGNTNSGSVPCTESHAAEVVGNAILAALTQLPQGNALGDAVAAQCAPLAARYAGGSLPAGTRWGYLGLAQSSWNAGDRVVQCIIQTIDGTGNPTQSTGSLKG